MDIKIFQMRPYVGEEEIAEIADSIRTNWITEGPKSKQFVDEILKLTGAKYGVLANNGTIALYLALKALGIGEGDEVIVANFSFYASASTIHWAGAKPVFVDIRKNDFNMDVSLIESKITSKTKAIMPVHIYGQSVDMDPLMKIARKHNLKVIEDACQGLGVYYKKDKHVGAIGDVGCFSFFADKTITTGGEGGMVVTSDEKIFEEMKYFRNQGRLTSGTFIHPKFGVNFRLTDLATGCGLAQLKKLDFIVNKKLANYNLYKKLLADVSEIEFLEEMEYSNFVPFRINVKVKNLEGIMKFMEDNGVQTRGCFYPLHKQPIFSELGNKDSDFPNSMYAYENAMSLPVHMELTPKDISYICDVIKKFYN
jgi:perosamine synthetase